MSEEMPRKRGAQWRNLIFLLIVLVVFGGFRIFNHVEPVTLQFEDDYMTLTGPEGAPFVVTVQYQEIHSISEITELDLGTYLTGLNTEKCWFGTWHNDAYGDYTLCASPAFSDYIVLETANGVIVFNYESADATQHFYPAMQELLDSYQAQQ